MIFKLKIWYVSQIPRPKLVLVLGTSSTIKYCELFLEERLDVILSYKQMIASI